MDKKSLSNIPSKPFTDIVYAAVKGSLYSQECHAFGLGEEELKALKAKHPGNDAKNYSGESVKTNVMNAINSLAQLGYKVICSSGETEITYTLQRED